MSDRIYPVPVKAASRINSWGAWPFDAEPQIREWNHGHLTFVRGPVFKCVDCAEFCQSHTYGAAVLDGDWLCDDCLIVRARAEVDRRNDEFLKQPRVYFPEEAEGAARPQPDRGRCRHRLRRGKDR